MSLEDRVERIEARNKRVEGDKAWETSSLRKFLIVTITYLMMVLTMSSIGVAKPWANAVIPTLGFFLSTLSLKFVKNIWLKGR